MSLVRIRVGLDGAVVKAESEGMDNDRIDLLERDVAALKSEVAVLKSVYAKSYEIRISRMEADIAQLSADVAELKADVAVLKADVAMLKAEFVLLRADVTQLQKDVAGILAQLPHMATKLDVKSLENRTRTWFIAGFLSLFTLQLAILGIFIGSR